MNGQAYIHIPSGARFEFVGHAPLADLVFLRRVDQPVTDGSTDLWVVTPGCFVEHFTKADDLTAVVPPARGEQPLSEFSTGPSSYGPLWSDEYLAALVSRWTEQQSGGAR